MHPHFGCFLAHRTSVCTSNTKHMQMFVVISMKPKERSENIWNKFVQLPNNQKQWFLRQLICLPIIILPVTAGAGVVISIVLMITSWKAEKSGTKTQQNNLRRQPPEQSVKGMKSICLDHASTGQNSDSGVLKNLSALKTEMQQICLAAELENLRAQRENLTF
jgi:hypothetical protein